MNAASPGAAHAICDVCGVSPCETPGFCEASRRDERARAKPDSSESPRLLMRELPPADPFPVYALGDVLGLAARAIHARVRAPLAICAQSALATATLAVQGHANVELPTGHSKPLSSYFVSIAATGERKSAADDEAQWPVRKREATLRENYTVDKLTFENDKEAWERARDAAITAKGVKGDRALMKCALDALGPAPQPPLEPILTCGDPTYEGLSKLLAVGQPSVGIFTAEGGQFIGGHGMDDKAKLRTISGLSRLWDGTPIDRVRASDGFTVLPGRRVAMHLMAQPDVAAIWFGDRLLLDQGLLSRVLGTAPEPASGTRMFKKPLPETDAVMKRYYARLIEILERPLPLAEGARNELAPRELPFSSGAERIWVAFHDHVEKRLAPGDELEPVRGLGNKLPEHAARIAAVLTLVDNIEAGEVASAEMEAGIALAQHYAAEALRLFAASRVSDGLRVAQQLLTWLQTVWPETLISLPDIYQRGPNAIREAACARRAVSILEEHLHLLAVPGGALVDGVFRRDVWRIVKV
jgi:hypothetical protein